MRKTQKLVNNLLAELERTGIPLTACNKVGVARSTYYRWRQDSISFKIQSDEAIRIGRENITDFAESKLVNNIGDGNQRAIEFQLRHNDERYRYFTQLEFARVLESRSQEKVNAEEKRPTQIILDTLFDATDITNIEKISLSDPFDTEISDYDRAMLEIEVKKLGAIKAMTELIETEAEKRINAITTPNNSHEDTVQ